MAVNLRLVKVATYQSSFQSFSPDIIAFVMSNPGATLTEVQQGVVGEYPGITEADCKIVLNALAQMQVVVIASDGQGTAVYYDSSGDWGAIVKDNLSAARTWVNNNNGGTIQEMAADLSLEWAEADILSQALEHEGTIRRVE